MNLRLLLAMFVTAAAGKSETSHLLVKDDLTVTILTDSHRLTASFGPRFDRTAHVASVRLKGVEFLHPHGLCDEFGLRGYGVIGYDEAAAGEPFVKPGFGRLVRDGNEPYFFGRRYAVQELFPVEVEAREHEVTVRQHVPGLYHYTKRYRLGPNSTLEIVYTLANLDDSSLPVETYNHNWFSFAGIRATTDYMVEPDFDLPGETPPAYTREGRILRLRTTPEGRGVNWSVEPGSPRAAHRVILSSTDGRRVEIAGDFPAARFALWSNDTALCPETFFRALLSPYETVSWKRSYTFRSPKPHHSPDTP